MTNGRRGFATPICNVSADKIRKRNKKRKKATHTRTSPVMTPTVRLTRGHNPPPPSPPTYLFATSSVGEKKSAAPVVSWDPDDNRLTLESGCATMADLVDLRTDANGINMGPVYHFSKVSHAVPVAPGREGVRNRVCHSSTGRKLIRYVAFELECERRVAKCSAYDRDTPPPTPPSTPPPTPPVLHLFEADSNPPLAAFETLSPDVGPAMRRRCHPRTHTAKDNARPNLFCFALNALNAVSVILSGPDYLHRKSNTCFFQGLGCTVLDTTTAIWRFVVLFVQVKYLCEYLKLY